MNSGIFSLSELRLTLAQGECFDKRTEIRLTQFNNVNSSKANPMQPLIIEGLCFGPWVKQLPPFHHKNAQKHILYTVNRVSFINAQFLPMTTQKKRESTIFCVIFCCCCYCRFINSSEVIRVRHLTVDGTFAVFIWLTMCICRANEVREL